MKLGDYLMNSSIPVKKRVVFYVVDKISVDISNRESFNHPGIRVATEKIGN